MLPLDTSPCSSSPQTPYDETLAIIDAIAHRYNLRRYNILGSGRIPGDAVARHAAIRAVAKAKPHLSLSNLGRIFRCHDSTISYALGRTKRSKRLEEPI